jgi:proliferating cell nuclear antigen PCNA
LSDVLKLSKSANIGLSYKPNEKLIIKLNERSTKRINFDMNLIDIDDSGLEIPELNYEIKVYIDYNEFQRSVKDLSAFGDKCNLVITDSNVTFSISGKVGKGDITIDDVDLEFEDGVDKEISSLLNIKYLNAFAKTGLSTEVILKLTKGIPFCFECQLEDGYIRFYIGEMEE